MAKGKFYAPQTSKNARPMTWEKDRHVKDWDKAEPETQGMDRAHDQKRRMRSDPDTKIGPI